VGPTRQRHSPTISVLSFPLSLSAQIRRLPCQRRGRRRLRDPQEEAAACRTPTSTPLPDGPIQGRRRLREPGEDDSACRTPTPPPPARSPCALAVAGAPLLRAASTSAVRPWVARRVDVVGLPLPLELEDLGTRLPRWEAGRPDGRERFRGGESWASPVTSSMSTRMTTAAAVPHSSLPALHHGSAATGKMPTPWRIASVLGMLRQLRGIAVRGRSTTRRETTAGE
jgi:hypothetical protein